MRSSPFPLLSLLLLVLLQPALAASPPPWTFIKGASTRGDPREASALSSAGGTHARAYLLWKYVQPSIDSFNRSLSVAAVRADPQRLVYDWADALDWSETDRRVAVLRNASLEVLGEAFEGTSSGLPSLNGKPAGPEALGEGPYLAASYRFARACVRRYKGVVRAWQVENELNEAYLESLGGIRPAGPWGNWTFVTEALRTLADAVRDEDAGALVTTNLHSEVPEAAHKALGLPGFYLDAAAEWAPMLDFVSLDAYPCDFNPDVTARPAVVGQRVAAIKAALPAGARVVVMETGYSALAPGTTSSGFPVFDYSEANQAAFVRAAYASVVAAGGDGFLYFNVAAERGQVAPGGAYTAADAAAFEAALQVVDSFNVSAGIDWLLGKHALQELPRVAEIAAGSGDGFGVLREDFSRRPAFEALAEVFAK